MPGTKPARSPATRPPIKSKLDKVNSMVTGLQAKLEETQRRADELHSKAERLHSAIDQLKGKAHERAPISGSLRKSQIR